MAGKIRFLLQRKQITSNLMTVKSRPVCNLSIFSHCFKQTQTPEAHSLHSIDLQKLFWIVYTVKPMLETTCIMQSTALALYQMTTFLGMGPNTQIFQ